MFVTVFILVYRVTTKMTRPLPIIPTVQMTPNTTTMMMFIGSTPRTRLTAWLTNSVRSQSVRFNRSPLAFPAHTSSSSVPLAIAGGQLCPASAGNMWWSPLFYGCWGHDGKRTSYTWLL